MEEKKYLKSGGLAALKPRIQN
jgi:hypothetical protein